MSHVDLDRKYITASRVREICGGISQTTFSRWLAREDLKFPTPVRIGTRRYFDESEVVEFLAARRRAT